MFIWLWMVFCYSYSSEVIKIRIELFLHQAIKSILIIRNIMILLSIFPILSDWCETMEYMQLTAKEMNELTFYTTDISYGLKNIFVWHILHCFHSKESHWNYVSFFWFYFLTREWASSGVNVLALHTYCVHLTVSNLTLNIQVLFNSNFVI
jgi:hypothetical protein